MKLTNMKLAKYIALLIGLSLLISACGRRNSSPPPDADANVEVVRIEIQPSGVVTLTNQNPTITLDAVVYGENDVVLNRSVTWSIEDETIAEITDTGQVTALAFGEPTTVTATAGGVSSTAIAINTAVLQDSIIAVVNTSRTSNCQGFRPVRQIILDVYRFT